MDVSPSLLQKRAGLEDVLAQISNQLAMTREPSVKHMLRLLGEAVGARYVYFVDIPRRGAPLHEVVAEDVELTIWHRDGKRAEERWLRDHISELEPGLQPLAYPRAGERSLKNGSHPEVALPIISGEGSLCGYLGIHCDTSKCRHLVEDREAVSMLNDLLVNYFRRKDVERSLEESEERWRTLVDSHPEPILITIEGRIVYINRAGARVLGGEDPAAMLSYRIADFVSAERQSSSNKPSSLISRDEQRRAVAPGELTEQEIIRLDGEERIVESISVPVTYEGSRAMQTILRDITERRASESRYRSFVQMISEAVWRVELTRALSIDTFPELQAEHILEHGRLTECNEVMARLLGAEDCGALVGRELKELLLYWTRDLAEEFVRAGYRLHNREVSLSVAGEPARHFVINVVGSVERGRLMHIWGSSVEITERVEMERRFLAMLEEQQERIGRDLHDSVGQLLTGIRMLSANLVTYYFDMADEGYGLAQKVARFADEASHHLHNIYRGLAPPQLYQEGLAIALEGMASTIDSLPGVGCTFIHDGRVDVRARETKLHLYRIAQEATNNALKHARAQNIWVTLEERGEKMALEIRDDGVGFDKDDFQGKSLGLYSLQHRAHSINAELSLDSSPGAGTRILCLLDKECRDAEAS